MSAPVHRAPERDWFSQFTRPNGRPKRRPSGEVEPGRDPSQSGPRTGSLGAHMLFSFQRPQPSRLRPAKRLQGTKKASRRRGP